jgi:hypothetical protein
VKLVAWLGTKRFKHVLRDKRHEKLLSFTLDWPILGFGRLIVIYASQHGFQFYTVLGTPRDNESFRSTFLSSLVSSFVSVTAFYITCRP